MKAFGSTVMMPMIAGSSESMGIVLKVWLPLVCVLLLSFTVRPILAEKGGSSSSTALFQPDEDPLGTKDTFIQLSEKEKKRWSRVEEAGVDAKVKTLKELETTVSVIISLVGFDGDGNHGINVNEADMQKFLDALKTDSHVNVIRSEAREMMVTTRLIFHATKAPNALNSDVTAAIEQAIHKIPVDMVTQTGMPPISPSEVDKVIAKDHENGAGGYMIYLLNPLQQKLGYSYAYSSNESCPGTFFVGKGRYVWVDLTAGSVSYGPVEEGEGLVTYDTFVRASDFPRDQFRKVPYSFADT